MAEAGAGTPAAAELAGWAGWEVDEVGGERVGRVEGIYVDARSGDPSWLVARLGRLRRPRSVAIPLRDCAGAAGRVWVAHEAEVIRRAPVVDATRPLLREHELLICEHFGIGEAVGRAMEVAGLPADAIASRPA